MPLPMEGDGDPGGDGGGSGAGEKRRKRNGQAVAEKRRKLLEGEKVEVRFSDDGLKGSWHPGVVVGCEKSTRLVEYDEILGDDNRSKLVESITVSKAVQGLTMTIPKKHRGNIRPAPSHHDIDGSEIRYGTCVDALVDDAWWEGVIFDHEDGSSDRLVFFPDQGDRHQISISRMRLTFDWNEVSGDWESRGQWKLLELLDKLEKEDPFPISVREIWYDVSCTDTFRLNIGEWIFGSWSTWRSLVLEIIKEALSVAQGEDNTAAAPLSRTMDISLALEGFENSNPDFAYVKSADFQKDDSQEITDGGHGNSREKTMQNNYLSDCPESTSHDYSMHSDVAGKDDCLETPVRGTMACLGHSLRDTVLTRRHPAILDYITERRNCSGPRSHGAKRRFKSIYQDAKKHLLSTGWEIDEFASGNKYYVSPDGKRYTSFIKACKAWSKVEVDDEVSSCANKKLMAGHQYSTLKNKTRSQQSKAPTTRKIPKSWHLVDFVAEYCPDAIENCARYTECGMSALRKPEETGHRLETLKINAKKHLLALGWRIYYKKESKGRQRFLYCSPSGEIFYSLRKLLEYVMEQNRTLFTENKEASEDLPGSDVFGKDIMILETPAKETFSNKNLVPEKCPEAILEYVSYMDAMEGKHAQNMSGEALKLIRFKAKKHLLYMGWRIWRKAKNGHYELRFDSPSPKHKCFASLHTACKAFLKGQFTANEGQVKADGTASIIEGNTLVELDNLPVEHNKLKIKFRCNGNALKETAKQSDNKTGNCSTFSPDSLQFGELGPNKLGKSGVKYSSCNKNHLSSSPICFEGLHETVKNSSCGHGTDYHKSKKRKSCRAISNHIGDPQNVFSELQGSKRARQGLPLSSSPHIPRTVLSLLIDNDLVLPRQKVSYIRKRDGHVMMEGRVTREGIKCSCCKKVHTLSSFEVHAGGTNHRPAAHIFLQDGRSLLDCQRQLFEGNSKKPRNFSHKRMKSDYSMYPSDAICSICNDGGTLLLCDYCPSSFHLNCVGLEDVPEGKWFCPFCQCSICGLGEFNSDSENFTAETKLFCDQCEREYHVECLEKSGLPRLTSCPQGYWLCGNTCSKIFWHLRELVGKSNPTDKEGFSWTILRSNKESDFDVPASDKEARAEYHSKLSVALDVLHECFVPIIEPRTGGDLAADLLFNKESELNRLNFWGFYTILVEKGDEVVSVATFRVYGEKIAEVPLVGTRVQYRRMGMCRLLINQLEKLLCSLGVERLLLPAVPQLFDTWTNSFGFSKMLQSDRLLLSKYPLLTFQGTTMCQKFLKSSTTSCEKLRGGEFSKYNEIVCDNSIIVPVPMVPPAVECALACEAAMVGEIDFEVNACSSPVTSSDGAGLLQEAEAPPKCRGTDQIAMNAVSGKKGDSYVLAEISPPILNLTQPVTDAKCELAGECYESATLETFKYIYKRKIFAN